MAKRITIIVAGVLLAGLLLVTVTTFQTDYNEVSLVKLFGKTRYVVTEPGLHFKWFWPVERVVTYDARTFILEDRTAEVQLKDKNQVYLTFYCTWRIAGGDGPVQFDKNVGSIANGEAKLRNILQSATGSVIGNYQMSDLVNTNKDRMRIQNIEGEILKPLNDSAKQNYGIEVVSLGLKSLGLTENVTKAVIDAQKQERQREIKSYDSQGQSEASAIRDRADQAAEQIIAFAKLKASDIRSKGMQAATEQYAKFKAAPELAIFLRSLETLKLLKNRTVLVLDPNTLALLNMFRFGPNADASPLKGVPATQPANTAAKASP
ncbi:MAG: SPFH domain-containing protein [Phycisphaerae bacterium]